MAGSRVGSDDPEGVPTVELRLDERARRALAGRYGEALTRVADRAIRDHGKKHPDEKRPPRFEPGEVGDPIVVGSDQLTSALRASLSPPGEPNRIVWHHRGSQAIIHLNTARVHVGTGAVIVGITVETAETGKEELTVPFAVGSEENPTGMMAATERRPRGHRGLAELWGEGVVALAWRALLEIADLVSIIAGRDVEGGTVRVGALVAGEGKLHIVPQARHDFERPVVIRPVAIDPSRPRR